MSNQVTHTVLSELYPVEWLREEPQTVLYATLLRSSGNDFGGEITVTDARGQQVGSFEFEYASGSNGKYLGKVNLPCGTQYPINISTRLTCSSEFSYDVSPQVAAGAKKQNNKLVPIAYQSQVFCNDNGNDNDWNDCVVTYQLFNASTD